MANEFTRRLRRPITRLPTCSRDLAPPALTVLAGPGSSGVHFVWRSVGACRSFPQRLSWSAVVLLRAAACPSVPWGDWKLLRRGCVPTRCLQRNKGFSSARRPRGDRRAGANCRSEPAVIQRLLRLGVVHRKRCGRSSVPDQLHPRHQPMTHEFVIKTAQIPGVESGPPPS